ncbi:hypothetical protein BO86DRAFT_234148 [Aspergillus japonicus CBS 114.51]|uniref:Uncharacterized protein n=1 Tax=Aspergillus japonicus CBS 114.51 TaxID=1448312 RepID=A0A8T8WMT8_ASPJA|nr:hypothetical protein BO86DRAFT_234148 [Aspergillus japonicus CBS 114.51]RAH77013.1 hypothetical protein BO86DRAFT_234148 [Aspergillus japonicus CBS 114.51]
MKRPVIMTRSLVSLPLALFHSHEPILSVVRRFIPPLTRAARTGNRSRRQLYSTLVQLSTIHICYAVILIVSFLTIPPPPFNDRNRDRNVYCWRDVDLDSAEAARNTVKTQPGCTAVSKKEEGWQTKPKV